ncbi:thioredoxin family protein [Candidatus Pelagibacter sp.]|nr:thioredoxin family protein [Candidatus Pelagibacter sp.]
MKKIFICFLFLFTLSANAIEKETTFNQKLFDKAQSEGKVIIISSWIEYCSSCLGQMKILQKAKNDGKLNDIEFDNIEYFSFDVTNRNIADLFNVQYQTTLIIFKNKEEVYRSLGETTKDLLYEAIKSSI